MTIRAAVLGFLGAVAICGLTYFNDYLLRQTFLVGNSLPVSVYGALILFLFFNAFLFRIRAKLALTGKELALILAMTLAACCIPSSGLLRTFFTTLIMPHYHNKTLAGWKKNRVIEEIAPRQMLVDVYEDVHVGQVKAVDGLKLTLDDAASTESERYSQMIVRVASGPGENQVRRILSYDGETRTAVIDEAWERLPDTSSRFAVRRSREERVLTPFLMGQTTSKNISYTTVVRGRSRAVNPDSITLSADLRLLDNTLLGMTVRLLTGEGKHEERMITAYDAGTQIAKVEGAWPESVVDTTPEYELFDSPEGGILEVVVQHADERTLQLPPTAASVQDAYCDMSVSVGTQKRKIIDYAGSTRTLTVQEPFASAPKPGSLAVIELKRDVSREGQVLSVDGPVVKLGPAASHRDREYVGMTLQITSGKGAGQKRKIAAYDGLQQKATVEKAWDDMLDGTSAYEVMSRQVVPWYAWVKPLLFWVPLILALWVALIGLSMVFHKQWADHEHLPYPIASFVSSLLPSEDGGISAVLKQRSFWIAGGVVFFVYVNNYIHMWVPDYWVAVPRSFELGGLAKAFGLDAWWLNRPTIFLTVVAIAYFLASDVSLSIGLSGFFYAIIFGSILSSYGVDMNAGDGSRLQYHRFMSFGAYLGIGVTILYTGRYYYLNILKRAVGIKSGEKLPTSGVWGARIFFGGAVVFVLLLAGIGLDWQLALLYAGCIILMFVVMGRIIAETGLFFIQSNWWPSAMLIGLLGTRSLGPEAMCILFLLCTVLAVDPREALMPFMVNSLKILDVREHKIGRSTALCTAALVIGLSVGIPTTLYLQYKNGAGVGGSWATHRVPTFAFDNTIHIKQQMEAKGILEESRQVSGFGRFIKIHPMRSWYLGAAAIGFVLVILFSFARQRFTWWPLHPIIFLVWKTYPIMVFSFSFLIGWLFKAIVMRFGGSQAYQKLKPMVIGIVAGELLGALLPIITGFIYYLVTGELPKKFNIFPG